MMGLYFDEVTLGQAIGLGAYEFTSDNVRRFKEQFAPVPFHLDDDAAAKGLFGQQVAVGFHLCAAWMPLFVAMNTQERSRLSSQGKVLPDIGAGFGIFDIQWPSPVIVGDTIHYRTTIADKKDLNSKPTWGLVEVFNEGLRNHQTVVQFTSKLLVAKR
jgi:acyl dehydratase